ncbi:MAG: hypothetical protein U5L46_03370 [Agrobacterium sp.]|nr:hypothetical protein [Agrobacterium sp.]
MDMIDSEADAKHFAGSDEVGNRAFIRPQLLDRPAAAGVRRA